jgi:cytochrome c
MRIAKIVLMVITILSVALSSAFAAGNIERGKKLFNDPKLSGSTNDASCNTCHPNGQGLEKAAEKGKKVWTTPAGTEISLKDAINICITAALKGKALDKNSRDMQDLVAYITSLGQKSPMKKSSGY